MRLKQGCDSSSVALMVRRCCVIRMYLKHGKDLVGMARVITSFMGLRGRIGLFGGSFDPVHVGHLKLVEQARMARKLDLIVFIPAAQNPLKQMQTSASARQRCKMLELALASNNKDCICTLELERTGLSYTIDTLKEFHIQAPEAEPFLIVGSDNLPNFHHWRHYDKILQLSEVVVVPREGFQRSDVMQLRENLPLSLLLLLEAAFISCSTLPWAATDIRALIAAGAGWEAMVATEVAEYINREGLYGVNDG